MSTLPRLDKSRGGVGYFEFRETKSLLNRRESAAEIISHASGFSFLMGSAVGQVVGSPGRLLLCVCTILTERELPYEYIFPRALIQCSHVDPHLTLFYPALDET